MTECKSILVTGGCGFIGSNFLNKFVKLHPEVKWVNVDCLSYAGDEKNVEVSGEENYVMEKVDIRDFDELSRVFEEHGIDGVINFAAETHVDNSVSGPKVFVETNVMGVQNLLDLGRKFGVKRMHQVGTDEVYGDVDFEAELCDEESCLNPSSPYSAAKAGADLLCLSYVRTFGSDVTISRCANNYGANQFPEKLIPLFCEKLKKGEKVSVYGDGKNMRDWLHVEDHGDAIWKIFKEGKKGEIYNVSGRVEKTNLEIVKMILEEAGKDESWIEFVPDRPGHDLRYALKADKIEDELGWKPKHKFEESFPETVKFYLKK